MLHQYPTVETSKILLHSSLSEDALYPYVYGVVIPYSSNLREPLELSKGEERLSFYSAFALNAAIEMYRHKIFQKFVLFSDATFGKVRKSTGLLMKEALLRTRTTPQIQESDILLFEANHLNNTPVQIKELRKYQLRNNLPDEQFLILNWSFHEERICWYMKGFGLAANTIKVEEAHKYYNHRFQSDKLYHVLPKAFEEREKKLGLLAQFDRRGLIPQFLKLFTGPVVTDIQKIRDANTSSSNEEKVNLVFENLSGIKKLCRMEGKRRFE